MLATIFDKNVFHVKCYRLGKDLTHLYGAVKLLDSCFFYYFFAGGTTPETNEIVTNICSCHNFFSLSSVQIIFIPACCLLCVL